jgi:hypothetical protein
VGEGRWRPRAGAGRREGVSGRQRTSAAGKREGVSGRRRAGGGERAACKWRRVKSSNASTVNRAGREGNKTDLFVSLLDSLQPNSSSSSRFNILQTKCEIQSMCLAPLEVIRSR